MFPYLPGAHALGLPGPYAIGFEGPGRQPPLARAQQNSPMPFSWILSTARHTRKCKIGIPCILSTRADSAHPASAVANTPAWRDAPSQKRARSGGQQDPGCKLRCWQPHTPLRVRHHHHHHVVWSRGGHLLTMMRWHQPRGGAGPGLVPPPAQRAGDLKGSGCLRPLGSISAADDHGLGWKMPMGACGRHARQQPFRQMMFEAL